MQKMTYLVFQKIIKEFLFILKEKKLKIFKVVLPNGIAMQPENN